MCNFFFDLVNRMKSKDPDARPTIEKVDEEFLEITKKLLVRLDAPSRTNLYNQATDFLQDAENPFRMLMENFSPENTGI